MKADRLFSIVLMLQQNHQMTARELASSLDVTERTIYRDIDALSLAGVPVYTRTGPDGGCFLDEGYRHSLNWFTGSELQTLMYAGTAAQLSDLGMDQAMNSAILKLLAMIPGRHRQSAEMAQQRLYLDPSNWYGNATADANLALLKDAVWRDLWVAAAYESWNGTQSQRRLAPYSLVNKAGRWYVVAQDGGTGEFRTFRAARFQHVELQPESFERDSTFDIVAYWEQHSAEFRQRIPTYPVTLRVKQNTMIYFRHMQFGRYEILEQSAETALLKVSYTSFEEARTSVLGLSTDADVIEPVSLKNAIIEQAKALLQRHAI